MTAEQAYRILRSLVNGRRRLKPDERQALDYARVVLAERIVDSQCDLVDQAVPALSPTNQTP